MYPRTKTVLHRRQAELLSLWLLLFVSVCFSTATRSEGVPEITPSVSVVMTQSPGGTYYLPASPAGVESEFLLDTGAGMVTLSEKTFSAIRNQVGVTKTRQVGARMANNRIQLMDVYEVSQFAIGDCELGPVEVAVMKGGSRNLLGLSALGIAAPFSIQTSPPVLSLSNCRIDATLAAAH